MLVGGGNLGALWTSHKPELSSNTVKPGKQMKISSKKWSCTLEKVGDVHLLSRCSHQSHGGMCETWLPQWDDYCSILEAHHRNVFNTHIELTHLHWTHQSLRRDWYIENAVHTVQRYEDNCIVTWLEVGISGHCVPAKILNSHQIQLHLSGI